MVEHCVRKPWVGQDYRAGGLLLVGESHYGTPEEEQDPCFTENLIRSYADRRWRHRYHTMVGAILTGRPGPQVDPHRLWHSVAFHNYVPAFMAGPGVAPSTADWVAGGEPLGNVLRDLEPGRAIILGKRLWEALAPHSGMAIERTAPMNLPRGEWDRVQLSAICAAPVSATWIRHPSRANRAEWHEVASTFLDGPWDGARTFDA